MAVTWAQAKCKGMAPSARAYHSMSCIGTKVFMFGGTGRDGGDGDPCALNDLFSLDVSNTDLLVWNEIHVNGEKPSPRYKHTALAVGKTKILIFGGMDGESRFNDVWVLDTVLMKWSSPDVEGAAPLPRAHHSCVLDKNRIFIFGGYGGHGKTYNDLHILDLGGLLDSEDDTPMQWIQPNVKGNLPAPRFDQTMSMYPGKLLILGGRDNSKMFKDVCVLDVETFTWMEETFSQYNYEISNHVTMAIESVPNYKLFTLFGKKGQMDYLNSVDVMDCGSQLWNTPTVVGVPPSSREGTATAYDSKACRIIVFGGWSNMWLDDLWTLNVSPIIGPPYACMSVSPDIGPVFGETTLEVHGLNFKSGSKIEVRFGTGRAETIVSGTFVDESTITCVTPNFEMFGAMEVDVRVNIGEGWTVNNVRFRYFANTSAKNCLAFGPGVYSQCLFGVSMPFMVLAKDTCNSKRTSGGDDFVITITDVNSDPGSDKSCKAKIVDLDNGIYEVTYMVPRPGRYRVDVGYDDLGDPPEILPIRGSPFIVDCIDPWTVTRTATSDSIPLQRVGATFSTVGTTMILYGGEEGADDKTGSAISVLDNVSKGEGEWSVTEDSGELVLTSRAHHSATAVNKNALAIFGGVVSGEDGPNETNELVLFKKEDNVWSWSIADLGNSSHEKTTEKPAEVKDENGGIDMTPEENGEETPKENGTSDHENGDAETNGVAESETVDTSSKKGFPKARQLHSSSSLPGNRVLIYGGECNGEILNDMFVVDCNTEPKSLTIPTVEGGSLKPRKGAAMASMGGILYVFGGMTRDEEDQDSLLSDLVVYDFDMPSLSFKEKLVEVTGDVPEPRMGAEFHSCKPGFLLLYGGTDASGQLLNTAYLLDATLLKWTLVYTADSSMLSEHTVSSTLGSTLVTLSIDPGATKYTVRTLDILAETEKYSFLRSMQNISSEELLDLTTFVTSMEEAVASATPLDSLSNNFDKLLTVMDGLYQIRSQKEDRDLQIDKLKETFYLMTKAKVSVVSKEKELEKLIERWDKIKHSAPTTKIDVQPVQDVVGEGIKGDIQSFVTKVDGYRRSFLEKDIFLYETGHEVAYTSLNSTHEELLKIEGEKDHLKRLSDIFEFPTLMEDAIAVVVECREDLKMLKECWDVVALLSVQLVEWKKTLWDDINTESMEDDTKSYVKEIKSLNKKLRTTAVYTGLDTEAKNFLVSMPLVADLRSPSMRDRHWSALMEATGVKLTIDKNFSLNDLLKLELHKFEDEVGEIVDRAQKEEKMEKSLAKLDETWSKIEFIFSAYKDTGVQLIKLGEEDFEVLEDNQVLVQGMMANRYMKTFENPILSWNKKLMTVYDVNQLMSEIQRTWSYLESLFIHSEEVKKELPDAAERFKGIDREVKDILKTAEKLKNVVRICTQDGLFSRLEKQQAELEVCEKALADYMETKRRAFPRFYFVSTAILLDILSNGNSPVKVQAHTSKCFQAIEKLKLDTESPPSGTRPKAQGIISCVGKEYLPFESEMTLEGKVENYMNDIITKMRKELRLHLGKAVQAYGNPKPRHDWLFDWSSQMILVVNQIYWCQEVEAAFDKFESGDKEAMKEYNKLQVNQLTELIKVTRGKLEKEDRQKVMNMITIDAHSRDVIRMIIDTKADKKDSFQWLSQLRTYWDAALGDAQVKVCDAVFPYGYEYLGNGGRLVITPLTDRIYITACQACWLSMGTAPQGPAGTGKTETTKDLSTQLGKSIYVFNCAPEMDYRTMGDIFKGLAASGSWGCFDEFNRLIPAVLSVCSVQYKCVTDAQKKKTFLPGRGLEYIDKDGVKHEAITDYKFIAADGVEMPLEEGTSAFITMNPGYIGRAELPESLKALFRPITVMVPDRQLIMENMLMAEGFVEANMLAKKFASLYYLLEDLLSPQKHYDWGLRAIKSVLVVAGGLLRAEEGQVESDVLFRALRDFNVPKILSADMVIFMGLLKDLFPGVDPPRKRDLSFEKTIVSEAAKLELTPSDDLVLRVVQLSELLAIRHCVFLMGPTGVGRTEAYRVLAKTIETGADEPSNPYLVANNKKKVTIRDINPKSITTQELYGFVNMSTREWKDGLLSYTMRELANVPNEDPKWIILDGDLDANWIESMNSVMDDNRLLTLPSNERIRLLPHMKMIFEIRNLKFASPATATRAGILYISEGDQWRSLVTSWLKRVLPGFAIKAKIKDIKIVEKWLYDFFEKYIPDTIFEMKKSYSYITPLSAINWVTSLINILESLLKPENLSSKHEQNHYEIYFVFAMIWSFGGGLTPKDGIDYRKNFDKWWRQKCSTVKIPSKGTVYDYFVSSKTTKFTLWSDVVQDISFDSSLQSMTDVFVPTPETSSMTFFLDAMIDMQKPIMFVGGAGCGKTQLVSGKLNNNLTADQKSLTINFNYFTDVVSFQKILEAPLEKKAGINYGPPGQSKLIYFVDDLNMPKLDSYETAMPLSLIRQHLGWGHWFDRNKLTQKNVTNTQYIACMNPTAGSFIVNPRLQRLFLTLAMDFPGQESLMKIYGTFLNSHLKTFSADCQDVGVKIIQASLANHAKVASTFRKTAVNFHYEFTVRHLSNVFQGLLTAKPETMNDPEKLSRLWLHESERVYADRLVSEADLITYNKSAESIAKKYFSINGIEDFYKKENARPLIFCDFANGLEDKVYNDVSSFDSLNTILIDALNEYNDTNPIMDLVLFEDAMKHVCRISRIISNPGGHALLVGVGGSGKQSLARLAAHICGYTTFMIVITGNYSISNLKEDIQKMYKKAGLKSEGVMFLFTDSQITDERFLVYINDLLSSGDIPDLFAPEDKDEIINAIRGEVKAAGLTDSRENCWNFFITKIRTYLHMVFTCSPVGEQFRTRAQRFPAMVNSTVIDWFQNWPEKALYGVAKKFLAEIDLGADTIRSSVESFMPFSVSCVGAMAKEFFKHERRNVYITPKTFLELIKLYTNLLTKKRLETQSSIDRLQNGLDKLNHTKADVDVLVEQAKIKKLEVETMVKESNIFAEEVGKEKEAANIENEAATVEKAKCEQIASEVAKKQESCEADLAAAGPLVEKAEAALDTLNKKDLGETKSLKKPPSGVEDVTAVVLILLQGNPKDKSWQAATKAMSNPEQFINQLKGYKALIDDGKVNKKHFDACRPYLELPHFNKEIIFGKSRAAAGLCDWAINIVAYFDVVMMVEPKKQELAEANAQLESANTILKEVQDKVADLNAKVQTLEEQYTEAVTAKDNAIAEAERTEKKLALANRLINALGSEGDRWASSIEVLKRDYEVLTGDMLMSAAFVSYSGPFTAKYRERLTQEWNKFLSTNGTPMTDHISVVKVLTDDATVAAWTSDELPSDTTSIENGTILTMGERWPLMCDPQLQGIKWIKSKEGKNGLQVVRMGGPKTMQVMERCLAEGTPVLIENMGESIDAVMMPIVTRSTFKKGRNMFVKIGDAEVEYHPNFKLFLHTKLSNPHYPPEIQAETTLINFTVTEDGLEDQLLALVVNKERPDLERTKTNIIIQNNEFTIKLKEIEDGLLSKLAAAEGDITEDVVLIESLEESKAVAEEINNKVEEAKITEVKINEAREKYRSVAGRGALLFFLLNSLNKIHAFYQFSLNAFVEVFARGIDKTVKKMSRKLSLKSIVRRMMGKFDWNVDLLTSLIPSRKAGALQPEKADEKKPELSPEELEARLKVLNDSITFTVFDFTRRGLFDRDKLIVSSLLTLSILLREKKIDKDEYSALMSLPRNFGAPQMIEEIENWMSEASWQSLSAIEKMSPFSGICKDIEKNVESWQEWASYEQCETKQIPGSWETRLSAFQKLVVMRAIRPDRICAAMENFVGKIMGENFVNQEAFEPAKVLNESGPSTPIFFILFPGYSPSKEIEEYAASQGKTVENGKLTIIAMGQGQEGPAEAAIDKYSKEGGWVFLDNVHLMQDWIPKLERKLEEAAESANNDFKCLFSAEPIAGAPLAKIIPESVLQTCVKVSNEPPSDMKSNMRRAFAAFSQETFDRSSTPEKQIAHKSILFGLCFYHSLLLGRKKYGVGIGTGSGSGLGFCRGYSFNMGDLINCTEVLYNYWKVV